MFMQAVNQQKIILNKMLKIKIFCIVLVLLCSFCNSQCDNPDCQREGAQEKQPKILQIVPEVEQNIRRIYWYFLRKAKVVYQGTVNTHDELLNFYLFKNIFGTFFCIAPYNKADKTSQVGNFIRLGDGFNEDYQSPFIPVKINPFVISLRLLRNEFLVDSTGKEFFNAGRQYRENTMKPNLKNLNEEQLSEHIDRKVRQKYSFYLKDSIKVHQNNILTNERVYSVITYVNVFGTFLTIASAEDDDSVKINTFVRLGQGSRKIQELQPIELEPSLIDIN